jgi:TRAP-type C4-dicarboxylate transport system permease small subunit
VAFLFRLSWGASLALAQLGKACLALMAALIVADVAIRNLGGRPPLWTIPVCEYLMLYIAGFGVPYLVRRKGHVVIEIVVRALRGRLRRNWERGIAIVAAATFFYLVGLAAVMMADAIATGDFQVRAIEVPTWIAYPPLVLGLGLGAIEFIRYLFVPESMFDRRAEEADSL